MKAIEDYGYVPNNAARNLKITDGKTIAVLVKGITNPFFSDMIRVFERDLVERGYSMILQHGGDRSSGGRNKLLLLYNSPRHSRQFAPEQRSKTRSQARPILQRVPRA